ncbi:uncharacterized protein VTP21DRAFT_8377 [Calcarisporiella thermophila]|uniref:uncharacterized protein n=1 Tax=Calcarisporiella thermophila TaxID=911321 RepID=UPI003743DD85
MYFFVSFLLLLSGVIAVTNEDYRHQHNDKSPAEFNFRLSTKSPYPWESANPRPGMLFLKKCKLEQVQVISRHGTRYPGKKDIKEFDALPSHFNKSELTGKYGWIQIWKNPFPIEKEDILDKQGERDLYLLGKRLAKHYDHFLSTFRYDETTVEFRSSSESRSGQSGSAFAIGLFEGRGTLTRSHIQPVYIPTLPKGQDTQLAPKYACQKWQNEVKNDKKGAREQAKFESEQLAGIASRLSGLFSIKVDTQLVKTIYKACAFEWAIFRRKETWCSLLNLDDFKLLEYYEDIEDYYKHSYGNPLNEYVGCDLATSLVKDMEAGLKKGVFKFGHSETVNFLYSALGFFKDERELDANWTKEDRERRKFRGSIISPFAANLIFELYNCANDGKVIQAYVNEQRVEIPNCKGVCKIDNFKQILGDKFECNFNKICENKDAMSN